MRYSCIVDITTIHCMSRCPLRPEQIGCHVADEQFQHISYHEHVLILIINLLFVAGNLISDMLALNIEIMA